MLNVEKLKKKNYIMDVPFFSKLPSQAKIRHTRNSNIKDQLFFDQHKGNEMKTFCVRMDHLDSK